MDIKSMASDVKKEVEGTWRTYPGTDFECLIARMDNDEYTAAEAKLRLSSEIQRRARKRKPLNEAESRLIIAPLVARHIIKGWRGLSEGGAIVEYSPQRAEDMLRDPRFKHFYTWVLTESRNDAEYMEDAEAEIAKN